MPPGKRKAAASSAADGAAPAAGQREERERGFDAKAVKDFLAKIDQLSPAITKAVWSGGVDQNQTRCAS